MESLRRQIHTIAVSGSRHFNDYDNFSKAMNTVIAKIGRPVLVVSGGCEGTDKLAELWAYREKIQFHEIPAEWKKYGRAAGPVRNQIMVDVAEVIIAFPTKNSTGTYDTINRAKKDSTKGLIVFKLIEKSEVIRNKN